MLGPLPAYGFCVEIVVGDVKGIANYEFSSYENKQWPLVAKGFDIDAMDVGLVVCTYACPHTDAHIVCPCLRLRERPRAL